MICSWLVLTILGQSATITEEPNPPAEVQQVQAPGQGSAQTQADGGTDAQAISTAANSPAATEADAGRPLE